MSQRKEKYARHMERRVDKLEGKVADINIDVITQGCRISAVEDDLAVYRAAVSAREIKQAEAEIRASNLTRRNERIRARKRKERLRVTAMIIVLAVLVTILAVRIYSTDGAEDPTPSPAASALPRPSAPAPAPEQLERDSKERERVATAATPEPQTTEEALLMSGYYSVAVPLEYNLQGVMREACAAYGCPYPLALAVAETESRFDLEAVGAIGEVGIMQLNPGPSGSYHTALEKETGHDPTTPEGNIICGVYLLGKYMVEYGDPAKAAMAYNMGEYGAREAWAAGVTSTDYTVEILAAMEDWECTVNALTGI